MLIGGEAVREWFWKVVEQLQQPAFMADLLSAAATTAVGVFVAVWAVRRQLRSTSDERRAERHTVLVEPLARALRADSRFFAELFGDLVVLEFSGMSLEPGRRRGYPGLDAVLEAMDAAKPALPFPDAVMRLIADREDRWAILHWVHLVRRHAFPISKPMAEIVDGLDLLGLDEDGNPLLHLLYIDVLPVVQRRVFESSVGLEEELGLLLHRWDGKETPAGWEPMPAGTPPLTGAELRKRIQEIVGIFNEEEARRRVQ